MVAIRPPRRTRSAGWSVVIGRSLQASRRAPRPHPTRRDGVASPAMTSVHLLHAGYTGERTASSIALVRDGDALIVVDPGMVARRSLILDPLAEMGVAAEAVTHVFLSHHHPDHTMNVALFPNAEVVDFWARYKDDLWLDMPGDGYRLSPKAQLWLTPGHTAEDASLIVEADDGVYAMTHLWWHADRSPGPGSVLRRSGRDHGRSRPGAGCRRRGHPRPRRPVPGGALGTGSSRCASSGRISRHPPPRSLHAPPLRHRRRDAACRVRQREHAIGHATTVGCRSVRRTERERAGARPSTPMP